MSVPKEALLLDQSLEDRFIRSSMHFHKLLVLTAKEISPDLFSTRIKADLWRAILLYWSAYERVPTVDILIVTMEEMYGDEHTSTLTSILNRIMELPIPEWKWVLSKIDKTIKGLKLHKSLYNASEMIKNGEIDKAESLIVDTIRTSGVLSETTTNDLDIPMSKLSMITDTTEDYCFPTRIAALDDMIKGIYRRELFIVISPMNVGKSWSIIHLATSALLSGKYVLYITLEMSRQRVLQRIMQNISGTYAPKDYNDISKEVSYWDEDWKNKELKTAPSLLDTKRVESCLKVVKNFGGHLSVRDFASATCTISDIEKCIELFDVSFNKVPDVVVVDGISDIKQQGGASKDVSAHRLNLTNLTRELRRLSSVYNCAVISTHQANREAINVKLVGSEHTSESIGIVQVADTCISLNQDRKEYELGLLRINVMRSRNQKKWGIVEVFQNLEIGQFCQVSRQSTAKYESKPTRGRRSRSESEND